MCCDCVWLLIWKMYFSLDFNCAKYILNNIPFTVRWNFIRKCCKIIPHLSCSEFVLRPNAKRAHAKIQKFKSKQKNEMETSKTVMAKQWLVFLKCCSTAQTNKINRYPLNYHLNDNKLFLLNTFTSIKHDIPFIAMIMSIMGATEYLNRLFLPSHSFSGQLKRS